MTLAAVRDGIVTSLDTIAGLKVYDHVPDSWNEFPAVAVRLVAVNYTDATFTFSVVVAVCGWDEGAAELDIHPYLEPAGASSIYGALTSDPACVVVSSGAVGRRELNGLPYLGAELTVVAKDA